MNIIFYIGDFTRTGGTERVTAVLASMLARRGYEVTVLSHQGEGRSTFDCDARVQLDSLHMEKHSGFIGRKVYPYLLLQDYLRKHSCDVFVMVDVLLGLYALPLRPLFRHSTFIAWEHFNFHANNGVKNRDRARAMAVHWADAVVVLTHADKEAYEDAFRNTNRIVVINNPIEPVEKQSVAVMSERKHKAIAIGRLTEQKNFEDMIIAWSQIEWRHPDWSLSILGEGELYQSLVRLISSLNVKHVFLEGFQKDVDSWYCESSLMLMTSKYEGLPMVLLEAQNNGLPIVSYDCFTGPAEIVINGRNGYLIPEGDINQFADHLDLLLSDEKLRTQQSIYALQDRARFFAKNIGNQWENLFLAVHAKN